MDSSSKSYFPLFDKKNWKEIKNKSRKIEKVEALSETLPQNGTEIPVTPTQA